MIGSLNLSGSGAGGNATAAGVIADLLRICEKNLGTSISNKLPKLKEKSIQDMDFCFSFFCPAKNIQIQPSSLKDSGVRFRS